MKEDQGARSVFSRKSPRVKREADSADASEQHDGNAAKARFARERGEGVEGVNSGGGTGGSEPYTAAAAAAAAGSLGEKRPNVAGFLVKAFQIFDNPAWSDVCGWGNNGETVVIRKQVEFAQRILPLYFNHSNLQSFVRQLNMYNFRKVVQDPNSGEFRHDIFRQGNGHLLHLIKRKQSATTPATSTFAREFSKMISASGAKQELENGDASRQYAGGTEESRAPDATKMAGGIMKEADSVLEELVRLRQWQKEMETTVFELKRANQTLQSENQMLKGHVTEHAKQQLVLQNKMQKILYCMYDVYMTGLRGVNGTQSAAIREITELADSKGGYGSGNSDGGEPVKNLADALAAGSALDGALAQLAALGGESISGRLNLLDMENPWASGSGSDSVSSGSGDAKGRSPSSGSSGANGVLGGGALRRNRTWSQSSYEWLRSLRDPDPLQFVAPESTSPVASPAAAAAAAAAAAGTTSAASTTTSLPRTISTAAAPTATSEAGGAVAAADGDGGSSARTSTANSWAKSAATATPERSGRVTKRQRRCADSVVFSSDSAGVDVDVNGSVHKGGHSGGREGEVVHRAPSFQPNAPILGDNEEECGGHDSGVELGSIREEGGSGSAGPAGSAEGQVWGGGALSRALSEGANQVVSELGELGHCEGEALSKIDSLGYQLANLLDASESIMGLDDVSVFDEGSGPLGLTGGASGSPSVSPSVSLSGGASGDGRAGSAGAGVALGEDSGSPENVEGAMATVNAPFDPNFNSISVSAVDGFVPLTHSEGPAPAAARVRDTGATGGVGVGDGRVATLPGYPATFPDVVVDPGVDALGNGGSSSDGIYKGVVGDEDMKVDVKVEAGTELTGSVGMDGEASAIGDNVNAVAIAEEDVGSRDKATTSSSMQAPLEISGMKGAPLPVVGGETG